MLSNLVNDITSFGNYIFFAVVFMICLGVATFAGVRLLKWNSVTVKIYGAVTGLSMAKLVAISLILLRILFFWSVIVYNTELNIGHIIYTLLLAAAMNLILSDVRLIVFDLPYTAVMLGSLYSMRLLREYLTGVRFHLLILIMTIVIIIFIFLTSLLNLLLCIRSVVSKKQGTHFSLKPKILLQRGAIILTGVLMTLVPYFYMSRMDTLSIRQDVYQYTADGKKSYHGVNIITRSGLGCILENKGKMYGLGNTPLYYANESKLMIPTVISIVQPKLSLSNRITNMSLMYENDGRYYVKNEKSTVKVSDFFLFDGKDTYLFFEPLTVSWDKNSVELSPMSYIIVKYNQSITIYDREKDVFRSVETGQCNALVTMNCGATVNLSTDVLSGEDGQENMLYLQPNLLEDLK